MSTLKEVLRTLPGYTLLRRMRRALSAATIQFNQTQTDQYRCSIDSFPLTSAGPVEHVSGWYLPAADEPVRIEVRLDEVTIAELSRIHRHDLADAFPNSPAAVLGGFGGDVVIPDHVRAGDTVTIAVRATSGTQQHTLIERSVRYAPQDASRLRVRHRPWGPIFQDPRTAQPIKLGTPFGAQTMLSDGGIPIIMGVPHFLPAGSAPLIRLLETGATHPYSCYADDVMAHCSGLVLDLGAGIQVPERLRDNVLNLDALQFPYVDVVNRHPELPFRSNVFEAVVSQAVFEHVPDPFKMAREIHRVLRPGGTVLIDTAFMQPFHGDPEHYFNMTKPGLLQIMQGFEIQDIGVRPYQNPSLGLIMQIEIILPFVRSHRWRRKLDQALRVLRESGAEFDETLGPVGREMLAAGVFVLAKKPG